MRLCLLFAKMVTQALCVLYVFLMKQEDSCDLGLMDATNVQT